MKLGSKDKSDFYVRQEIVPFKISSRPRAIHRYQGTASTEACREGGEAEKDGRWGFGELTLTAQEWLLVFIVMTRVDNNCYYLPTLSSVVDIFLL